MKFLGRNEEMQRLRKFLSATEGGLACVYGRRRIGKSRLLAEVTRGRRDVVSHIADRSDVALQRARLASDLSKLLKGFGDVAYLDWGTLFDRWLRDAPRKSILVIDEFPYLVMQSPELPSVLQRILEEIRPTGLKIIICGSSQRMMQGLVLKESEPLYGRAREILKIEPLGCRYLKEAFPKLKISELLEHYGVWGGVPRYWELSEGETNLWDTLRQQVYSSLGLLRNEPNYLLLDALSDSVQASSVLALIGMGVSRLTEIAGRLQIPATALTRPLKRLVDLDLVRREVPFGENVKSGKRSIYRVADPFLAFWYRFVLPNYSDEHYLEDAADRAELQRLYRVYLGVVWEDIVREAVGRLKLSGFSFRFRNVARWWGTGLNRAPMEFDVVAESPDRKTLLVGEAKLSLTKTEMERALAELQEKAKLLPFATKYDKVVCQLFVAESPCKGNCDMLWAMSE